MGFELLLVVVPFIANVSLGVLVISQKPRTPQNIFFFVAAIAITLWATSSFLTDNAWSDDAKQSFAYVTYAFAFLALNALFWFSIAFKNAEQRIENKYIPLILLGVAGSVVSGTGLVVDGINPTEDYTEIIAGPAFSIYLALVGLFFVLTAINMIRAIVKPLNRAHKRQAQSIVIGTGLSFGLIMITNAIYPGITGDWSSAALGPSLTVFIVASITYAIIRHRLFDVKAAVARALGYIGAISGVVLVYLTIVFVLSGTDLIGDNLSTFQRVAFAVVAVVSGFLFQPFKRFFDRLTSRLFYRDAYDPQSFIDKLNSNLVNNVDLEGLLTKSALIIQENLKASFCTFYIRETSYFPDRIIGAHRKDPEVDDLDDLQKWAPKLHKKIHAVDLDNETVAEKEVTKILRKNDVEVMARLVNTLDFEVKGIGYVLIGPKKSGSQFSKQDLKILEIVTNELVIATENVLRFEEIEQFNVTLQKKIDDATKELKANNAKLRALDEAKDEFVSMASHQLRTPLTSIKGYISMVLEGDAGKINETQAKMLGQALFSSQRMVYLIADLLNVSRLKTGKFTIEQKPVYLPDVVESEVEQLYEGAGAKNIKLSFAKPKAFPSLNLDEMKIRQVVMNFTDNAIYYTPNGGTITIELKETAKSIEFTVKDSGIGVPKAQQPKLFSKFYRADNARKARPDGTGLGLFMAKKVIIAQGGSMIFKSVENKGSTFGFSFPKEKLEAKTEK